MSDTLIVVITTQCRNDVMQNVLTSNSYNFVVSEPIWTIPSALETGEKRATFHRNNLKVRHVEIKEKSKMIITYRADRYVGWALQQLQLFHNDERITPLVS